MKVTGMLVVSLRGVNCRFWSQLGCSGQKANIFKITIALIWLSVLVWSPSGVKLSLSHAQIGLLWGFNYNFPTSIPVPFMWESPPQGETSKRCSLILSLTCTLLVTNLLQCVMDDALMLAFQVFGQFCKHSHAKFMFRCQTGF